MFQAEEASGTKVRSGGVGQALKLCGSDPASWKPDEECEFHFNALKKQRSFKTESLGLFCREWSLGKERVEAERPAGGRATSETDVRESALRTVRVKRSDGLLCVLLDF